MAKNKRTKISILVMLCLTFVFSVLFVGANSFKTNNSLQEPPRVPVNALSTNTGFSTNQYIIVAGKAYKYNPEDSVVAPNQDASWGITFNEQNTLELIFMKDGVSKLSSFAVNNSEIASVFQATKTADGIDIIITDEYDSVSIQTSQDAIYTLHELALCASAQLNYANNVFSLGQKKSSVGFTAIDPEQSKSYAQILIVESGSFNINGSKTYKPKTGVVGRAFYQTGGTLSFTNVTLDGFSHNGNGGTIYMAGGTLNVSAYIINSSATNGNGGAIYCDNGTINLTGGCLGNSGSSSAATSTAYSNFASNNGGAVYLNSNSTLKIAGGSIGYNCANNGGAVYSAANTNTIEMSKGTVNLNCAATGSGGAIYCNGGSLNITGGVVGSMFASSTATSSSYSNYANGSGGAIYITNGTELTVTNATIAYNCGTFGGAIYSASSNDKLSLSSGGIFNYNYARSGSGGAVYSYGKVTIGNSKFQYNTANTYGGALMVKSNIDNCNYSGYFAYNKTERNDGGAIRVDGQLTCYGGSIVSNQSAGSAGGISVNGILALNGCGIISNTAKTNGGAVCINSGSTFNLYSCEMFDNKATANGQQIYLSSNTYVRVDNNLNKNYTVYKQGLTSYDDNTGNTSVIAYTTNAEHLETAKSKIIVENFETYHQLSSDRKANYLVCEYRTSSLAIDPNNATDTYFNTTTYGTYIKNAASFDGDDYKVVGREYMFTDKITINVWASMANWANYTSGMRIYSCTEGGGWNIESSGGNIQFACYDYGVGYKVVNATKAWSSLSSGWHMFSMTFDGNYVRAYIDGVLYGTSTQYTSGKLGYNATNAIFVGAEASTSLTTPAGSYFNGQIQDFFIVNDCYYESEIADIYANGKGYIYISKNAGETYSLTTPENTGHNLTAWQLSGNGTLTGTSAPYTYTFAGGHSAVVAQWTPFDLVLTLDNDGGRVTLTQTLYYQYGKNYFYKMGYASDNIYNPDNLLADGKVIIPSKTGHTFGGYYTQKNGAGTQYITEQGVILDSLSTAFITNTTLYAKWTANKYAMQVITGSGNLFNLSQLATAKTDYAPSGSKNANYSYDPKTMQFTYNSTKADDPYIPLHITANLTAGTKYYFHLTALNTDGTLPTQTRWGIFWAVGGPSFVGTQYFNVTNHDGNQYGDCMGSFTAPTTGTYHFRLDEQAANVGTWIISNMWVGTASNFSEPTDTTYGSTTTLTVPVWAGHTFKGWQLFGAGSISGNTFTMGAGKATISAIWETNEHTVTLERYINNEESADVEFWDYRLTVVALVNGEVDNGCWWNQKTYYYGTIFCIDHVEYVGYDYRTISDGINNTGNGWVFFDYEELDITEDIAFRIDYLSNQSLTTTNTTGGSVTTASQQLPYGTRVYRDSTNKNKLKFEICVQTNWHQFTYNFDNTAITATPSTGYHFVRWATSSTSTTDLTEKYIESSTTIYAQFEKNDYMVKIYYYMDGCGADDYVTFDDFYYEHLETNIAIDRIDQRFYGENSDIDEDGIPYHYIILPYQTTFEILSITQDGANTPIEDGLADLDYGAACWDYGEYTITSDLTLSIVYYHDNTQITIGRNTTAGGTVSKESFKVPSGTNVWASGASLYFQHTLYTLDNYFQYTAEVIKATANTGYSFTRWGATATTTTAWALKSVTSATTIYAQFTQNTATIKLGSLTNVTKVYYGTSSSNITTQLTTSGFTAKSNTNYYFKAEVSTAAGYTITFSKWSGWFSDTTATSSAHSFTDNGNTYTINATATKSANTITITIDDNGATKNSTYATLYYIYGDTKVYKAPVFIDTNKVTLTPKPEKTGYTYTGHYSSNNKQCIDGNGKFTSGFTTFSSNQTFTARWTAHVYKIEYTNCNVNTMTNAPTSATFGIGFNVSAPSATGYTFQGWRISGMDSCTHYYGTSSSSYSTTTNEVITSTKSTWFKNLTAVNGDTITFAAVMGANTITITIDDNGATKKSTYAALYYIYGDTKVYKAPVFIDSNKVTLTIKPEKTGYTYTGHYSSNNKQCIDGNGKFTSDFTTFSSNQTFTARWTAHKYTISYSLGSWAFASGVNHPTSVTYDSGFNLGRPTRTGWTFSSWDISGMDSCTHYYGTSSSSYSTSTSTSLSGITSTWFKNLRASSGTVTFTPNGTINKFNIQITAVDGNYGSVSQQYIYNVPYNSSITVGGSTNNTLTINSTTCTATKKSVAGHTVSWNGWTLDNGTSLPATVTTNLSIYANFSATVNNYTITFKPNKPSNASGSVSLSQASLVVTYGEQINGNYTASILGWIFKGYYTAASDGIQVFGDDGTVNNSVSGFTDSSGKWIGTSNKSVYAQWEAKQYDIEYELNDGTAGKFAPAYASYDQELGVHITNPTRTGYVFQGWTIRGLDSCTHKYGDSSSSYSTTTTTSISNTFATWYQNLRSSGGTVLFIANWSEPVEYTITYTNLRFTDGFDEFGDPVEKHYESEESKVYYFYQKYTINTNLTLYSAIKENASIDDDEAWRVTEDVGSWALDELMGNGASLGSGNYGDVTLSLQYTWDQYKLVFESADRENLISSVYPNLLNPSYKDEIYVRYNGSLSTAYFLDGTLAFTSMPDQIDGFDGWYRDSGKTKDKIKFTTQMNDQSSFEIDRENYTITLYAGFKKVTVVFLDEKCGNSGVDTEYGLVITLPAPSATGYTFKGWYEQENGGGAKYGDGGSNYTVLSTSVIKMNSYWKTNVYNINYVLNGFTNGSDAPTQMLYDEGFELAAPTKKGYYFTGWKITGMNNGVAHEYGDQGNTYTTYGTTLEVDEYIIWFKNLHSEDGATVTFEATGAAMYYALTVSPGGGTITFKSGSTTITNPNIYALYDSKKLYHSAAAPEYLGDGKAVSEITSISGVNTGKTLKGFATPYNTIAKGACTFDKNYAPGQGQYLYASWAANYYKLTLNTNGGSITFGYNSTTTTSPTLYALYGSKTIYQSTATPSYNGDGKTVYAITSISATLTGHTYTQLTTNTTPVYSISSGAYQFNNAYEVDSASTLSADFRANYQLLLVKPAGGTLTFTYSGGTTTGINVYARHNSTKLYYSNASPVYYNDGKAVKEITAISGSYTGYTLTTLTTTTHTIYKGECAFSEAYTSGSGTVLTANWAANYYKLTINGNGGTLAFAYNGGSNDGSNIYARYNSTSLFYSAASPSYNGDGKAVQTITAITGSRKGYTLTGLSTGTYTISKGGQTLSAAYKTAAGSTLTASWAANYYALTINNGGKEVIFTYSGGTSTGTGIYVRYGTKNLYYAATTPSYYGDGVTVSLISSISSGLVVGYTLTTLTTNTNPVYTIAKGGYSFNANYEVDSNCTLTANWAGNYYLLTVNGNGGTLSFAYSGGTSTGANIYVIYGGKKLYYSTATPVYSGDGKAVQEITAITGSRSGYTLNTLATGTYIINKGACQYSTNFEYVPKANIPLVANWIANTYTLTWNGNATVGDLLTADYWNYAGSTGYTSSNAGYRGSFSISGIAPTSSITYDSAAAYRAPIPIRRGHTFNGWFTATSGGAKIVDANGSFVAGVTNYTDASGNWIKAANTQLYAQWTAKSYSLTVNNNGGSGSSSTTYTTVSGATINAPTRAGYNFTGWSVTISLNKMNNATINYNSGIQEYNASYPNAVYYELFYIKSGVSYTGALGGGEIRWRNFNPTTGVFVSSYSSSQTVSGNNTNAVLWYHNGKSETTTTITFSTGATAFKTADYGLTGLVGLTANWSAANYTITYDANGGTLSGTAGTDYTTSYNITTAITLPSGTYIKRNGYAFNGWKVTTAAGNWTANAPFTTSVEAGKYGNVTLTAQWTAKIYIITYEANGGTLSDESAYYTTVYTIESAITLPSTTYIQRTGYSFNGWKVTTAAGNWAANAVFTSSVEAGKYGAVTLTAMWIQNTSTIKLGTLTNVAKVYYGTSASSITTQLTTSGFTAKTNTNYYFKAELATAQTGYKMVFSKWSGWFSDTTITSSGHSFTASGQTYTVSASAIESGITYQVAFNGNGATSGTMSNQTHTYGQKLALTENAYTRSYLVRYSGGVGGTATVSSDTATYTFAGWSTTANGAVQYQDKASVENLRNTSGTYNLYAQWNAGSVTLPTATREGYTLSYWGILRNNNYESVGGVGDSFTPTEGTTLVAQWTENTYNLMFTEFDLSSSSNSSVVGDGVLDGTKTIGDTVISYYYTTYTTTFTINAPKRTGYSFIGWKVYEVVNETTSTTIYTCTSSTRYSSLTTKQDGTIVFEAVWKAHYYSININSNGGNVVTYINGTSHVSPMYVRSGSSKFYKAYNNAIVPSYYDQSDGYSYDSSGNSGYVPSVTLYATRSGYSFMGLYTASSGGTRVATASDLLPNAAGYTDSNGNWASVTGVVTLYAQWTQTVTTTTVNYEMSRVEDAEEKGQLGFGVGTITLSYGDTSKSLTNAGTLTSSFTLNSSDVVMVSAVILCQFQLYGLIGMNIFYFVNIDIYNGSSLVESFELEGDYWTTTNRSVDITSSLKNGYKIKIYPTCLTRIIGIGGGDSVDPVSNDISDSNAVAKPLVVTLDNSGAAATNASAIWLDDKFRKLQEKKPTELDFEGISFST